MTSISKWSAVMVAVAAGVLFAQTPAAKPTIQRTILQSKDISVPGREAVIARVEIAPESFAGRHTHPGEEMSYILEGEGEILIEGQPALKVKAGDSFIIPAGAKHDAHNTGKQPLKLVGIYLVDKSQPMATPAP